MMVKRVELIGKEANRWEEQVYLGENSEVQIVYGSARDDTERHRRAVLEALASYSLAQVARMTGLEKSTILRVRRGGRGSRKTWDCLLAATAERRPPCGDVK